jgi:hypothetical protein
MQDDLQRFPPPLRVAGGECLIRLAFVSAVEKLLDQCGAIYSGTTSYGICDK